jgi:tetratricopeptide (TPR) repeat protein
VVKKPSGGEAAGLRRFGRRVGVGLALPLLLLADCQSPARDPGQLSEPAPRHAEAGPATSLVELGEEALARGEIDLAETRFRRALEADREATPPRLGLARVALDRGEPDTARRLAGEVLERAPEDPAALVVLARLERNAGAEAEARQHLERALRAEPLRLEAHAELALLTGRAPRRPSQDLVEALRVADAHPYDPWGRLQAARLLLERGHPEEARSQLADHTWFADLDPASGMAAFRLLQRLDEQWADRRIVPVHCYADESVRQSPGWEMRLRAVWASLSASLDPVLETAFVPVSLASFSSSSAGGALDSIEKAFRSSVRALPAAGIIAAFTERAVPKRRGKERLGQAEYTGRRMLVRLEPGKVESRTLIHEVLHLYGAVHINPDLDSIMNPSGASLDLDPANRAIIELLRGRRFGPGGVEANVLPFVEQGELTAAIAQALRLNLEFRRLGVLEALEARESSRFLGARKAREAVALDPDLASVARFLALLLAEQQRFVSAARFMEAAAQLHGPRSAEGREARAGAEALLSRAREGNGEEREP